MNRFSFFKIIIFFFLISISGILSSANNYSLTVLSGNDGLSQQDVECIVQDKLGFIWVGTYDGLNRYDGNNFKQFRHIPNNPNSISDNRILSLQEWPERDELWIGTDGGGLNCYNLSSAQFTHYLANKTKKNNITDNQVICLYKSGNDLWAGTSNGPHKISFSPDNEAIIEHYILKSNNKADMLQYTITIGEDYYNNIIAGTRKGIYMKKHNENEFRSISSPEQELDVRQIFKDSTGNLWIITTSKIYFYSTSIQKIQDYLSKPYILDFTSKNTNRKIIQLSENIFFFLTEGEVYWIKHIDNLFEIEEISFTKNTFVDDNMLKDLMIDRSMNVWITSQMDGIARFDLNAKSIYHYPLNHPQAPEKIFIQALISDKQGRLWIGSTKGLFVEDINRNKTIKVESINERIFGLLEDRENNIWVTSLDNIYFVPEGNIAKLRKIDQSYNLPENVYPFDGPYAICTDKMRNIIWIGMRSGIMQIRSNNGNFRFSLKDIQPSESLRAVNNITILHYNENENFLLIGTKNAGLLYAELSDEGDIVHIIPIREETNKEKEEHIWSVLETSDNTIYIGTDSGIKRLAYKDKNKLSLTHFNDDYRMQSLKVVSIIEDNDKNLWFCTGMGLFRYSIQNKQITQFLNTDGLRTNILGEGTVFDADKNILYVGSVKGLNIVDLSSLNINNIAPDVRFTSLKINNTPIIPREEFNGRIILDKSLESADKIKLRYNENNFTVEFAALHFSNPDKNKFQYLLQGFENEWIEVNNNIRSATFTNVPPGNYTLLVKSANSDDVWNNTPKTLDIVIEPAPWDTAWAYLLYFLIVSLLLFFIYKYFNDRKKIKQKLFLEQMEHKKEMEIAEVKLKYHTNITHELRTPLSLIIAPTSELLDKSYKDHYLNSQLNTIKSNAERLMKLINQFLDFRKIVNDKYNIHIRRENISIVLKEIKDYFSGAALQKEIVIELYNDLSTDYCWVDKEIINKICSNLISNAIKHTNSQGKISIYASQSEDGSKLFISIEDTGAGIVEEEIDKIFDRFYQIPGSTGGTGIGLNLCRHLATLHSGKISVKSRSGEGSIFTLEIPIDRNAYEETVISEPDLHEDEKNLQATTNDSETEIKNKPLILVIEDNYELCDYITTLLKENANVISAHNGEEGYNMAVNNIPDIIVSDIMMPVMDGIELTHKCKNDTRTSHIPIILLTAKETVESEIEGLSYGADDYITKPFNARILKLRIKNLLKLTMRKKEEAEEITKLNEREQKFLATFENIVMENLSSPDFGIEEIGRIMAMSRMQLYRKMTAVIGKKPSQYINEIKMKKAYILLKDKGLNITEVMYELGYSNHSHFSKKFFEVNGILPREILGMKK